MGNEKLRVGTKQSKGGALKQPASPESTGGVGPWYEAQVVALYLVELLVEGSLIGGPISVPTHVAVQQAGAGRPLDDLVVSARTDDGERVQLDLQIKHRLNVSPTDKNFVDVVMGAWRTIGTEGFSHGPNRAGAAAAKLGEDPLHAAAKMQDIAAKAANGLAFDAALAYPMQLNGADRRLLEAVRKILVDHLKRALTPDERHRFWRHFVLLRFDTGGAAARDRHYAVATLRRAFPTASMAAEDILLKLEELVRGNTIRALPIDRAQLFVRLEAVGVHLDRRTAIERRTAEDIRTAAAADVASWRRQRGDAEVPARFIRFDSAPTAKEPEGVGLAEFVDHWITERCLVIEAEPGAGKSVSLVQLAEHLLASQNDVVPLLCPLPTAAKLSSGIFSFLESRDALRSAQIDDIGVAARSTRLALLLDGWNELDPQQREAVWLELGEIERQHPDILLVVAGRSGIPSALASARVYGVQGFDRAQQYRLAEILLGEAGAEVLRRARASDALRPLLGTPFLLRAILLQASDGNLPDSRESTIAGMVRRVADEGVRAAALTSQFKGTHERVLEAIAWSLMTRSTTKLSEAEALAIIEEEGVKLRQERLVFSDLNVEMALEALLAHHLLVADVVGGQRSIAFQHQLFQEWFASRRLDALVMAFPALDPQLPCIADDPIWSVTLDLSVERLRNVDEAAPALGKFLCWLIGVAPLEAAALLSVAGEPVWRLVGMSVENFANAWLRDDRERASRFMLQSGRPEFADHIWSAFREDRQLFHQMRRAARDIPLSGIAPDWDDQFPRLPREARRVLLADLILQGSSAAVRTAVRAASSDAEPEVVHTAIDYLDGYGESDQLNCLLASLSDNMFAQATRGKRLEHAVPEQAARLAAVREQEFAESDKPRKAMLALAAGKLSPGEIVALALDGPDETKHGHHAALQAVAERFPKEFGSALVERILAGLRLPWDCGQYLENISSSEQDSLQILSLTRAQFDQRPAMAAYLLDQDTLTGLLKSLLKLSDEDALRRSREAVPIVEALKSAKLDQLLPALLGCEPANAGQATDLATILGGWHGARREPQAFAPMPEQLSAAAAAVTSWSALVLSHVGGLRSQLESCARAIGRLAKPELIPLLRRLLDEDERRQALQVEAVEHATPLSTSGEARMRYERSYQNAFVAIGGAPAVAALTDLIRNDRFAAFAAAGLANLCGNSPSAEIDMSFRADVEIEQRRVELVQTERTPASPEAIVLIQRVEQLIARGDASSLWLAAQIAMSATRMRYGPLRSVFLELLDLPLDCASASRLAGAFARQGEALPWAVVVRGLSQALEDLASRQWVPDNDYWLAREWVWLIGYTDDPLAAVASLPALPVVITAHHRLADVAKQIARSGQPTAREALHRLAAISPKLQHAHCFLEAFSALGTEAAAFDLLKLATASDAAIAKGHDAYFTVKLLAQAFAAHPPAKETAFSMLAGIQDDAETLLASALAEEMTEADAIRLLTLSGPAETDRIGRALVGRLGDLALARRPIEGSTNFHELEARPLAELRHHAFKLVLGEGPTAHWGSSVLQAIDHIRDEYGKPADEPQHPDLSQHRAWPVAAQSLWDGIVSAKDPGTLVSVGVAMTRATERD